MKKVAYAAALSALGAAWPALSRAQTLEAAGLSVGTPVQVSSFRPVLQVSTTSAGAGGVTSNTYEVKSPEGGGLRLGAYGRWKLGEQGAFVQTEAAYNRLTTFGYTLDTETRTAGGSTTISAVASSVLQARLDAGALAGYRLGRAYVLAGPVLGYTLRRNLNDIGPEEQELTDALVQSPPRVQALVQAGLGLTFWRFDLTARYERSLTPAVRDVRLGGRTYDFRHPGQQVLVSLGFRLVGSDGR